MRKQNARVILASEYPQVRHLFREVIEQESGSVIVGQAANATKALTLARNLRPDFAIIDSYLPHTVGLDGVPMSRMGGLDAAQTISDEIPNTRVILLPNLDAETLPEHSLAPYHNAASFSRKINGAMMPFTLQELYHEASLPNAVIFANVEVKQRTSFWQQLTKISDKAILLGGLGVLGGLCLMLTIVLAGAGVFLVAAGAATILFGLAGKFTPALLPKGKSQTK